MAPPEITCEETAQIALCLFWAGDVTKYYPSFAVENNGIVICKLEKITEIGSNRMPKALRNLICLVKKLVLSY